MNFAEVNNMRQTWQSNIENFFLLFILIQPFLDILAFWGMPISLIFRVVAMGIGFIYILVLPNSKSKKHILTYFVVLGVFLIIHTGINIIVKDPYLIVEELKYTIKTIFVVEMILVYTQVFFSLKNKLDWQNIVQRNIFISMSIVGIFMLLAEITNTGKRSYGHLMKEGHSGWFFSGNELSAILAMGFAIMILYFIKLNKLTYKLVLLPFVLLVIWASLQVGTKVGLGAVLGILFITGILLFIAVLNKKTSISNFVLISVIAIGTIFYLPYSSIGHNMDFTILKITSENNSDENEEIIPDDNTTTENEDSDIFDEEKLDLNDEETKSLLENKWINIFLSGRENFFVRTLNHFNDAPITQKLFGMGIGGNYNSHMKLIEMDYLDWFFSYGIIGFILLFGLLVYFAIQILVSLVKDKLMQINKGYLLILLSVCLGLGVALLAGHVLFNPASGIYLALGISYLYVLTLSNKTT